MDARQLSPKNENHGQGGVIATPYDNDVTLLYKNAALFQLPIRLILVNRLDDTEETGNNYEYISYLTVIQQIINGNYNIKQIYDIIHQVNNSINIDDVIMGYYSLIRGQERNDNIYLIINQAYNNLGESGNKFVDNRDLDITYSMWKTQVDNDITKDEIRLSKIIEIQKILEKTHNDILAKGSNNILFGDVVINSSIMAFTPTINGRTVNITDGPDIFNQSVTSIVVPFIKYNDEFGKSLYRVYTGNKIEDLPNYNNTIIPAIESGNKNTLYLTLWLGAADGDLHNAPRESFYTVIYNLEKNYLTVESPIGFNKKYFTRNEETAISRTQNSLHFLDFGQGKEVKVRGDFTMWNLDFDETTFLDMILLDPTFYVYLYVEENIKPFAFKKRLDIHYRSIYSDLTEGTTITDEAYISNSASVSITLSHKILHNDETINVNSPANGSFSRKTTLVPAGTNYINVSISQGESRLVVNDFIKIFQLLMTVYLEKKQKISDVYSDNFGFDIKNLDVLLATRKLKSLPKDSYIKSINSREDAKIKKLREKAPDLFVQTYARRCQCPLQPIIIENDEINEWKGKRINDIADNRQIMVFPAGPLSTDARQWNFVCPDDNYPYPGVKINKDLPNRDKYPYIPCCFRKDQITPGLNSKYNNYIQGNRVDITIGAKAEKKISTNKILVPDKIAYLPRSVLSIVKRYSEESADMVRYGVIFSPNSLLHCVCVALDDPTYYNFTSDADRENYIITLRKYIAQNINLSLLKQELFDYTDDEIRQVVSDDLIFFDPSLFYRAVEEIFHLNLYVFSSADNNDSNNLGNLALPRFKNFYCRPIRLNRPTILIIKMYGSESDALSYPQCELIVDYDPDNFAVSKLFGSEMTQLCHNIFIKSLKTLTWSVLPTNQFQVRNNLYYLINHLQIFNLRPLSQFIDNNGKLRALTFSRNNQKLTVVTIPSQPENLPLSLELSPTPYLTAISIFGQPSGYTHDSSGNLSGLWFQILDLTFGEFVPVVSLPLPLSLKSLPIGPNNPIFSSSHNVTSRLPILRRTLNIIVQLIKWLYTLASSQQNIDPTTFANLYFVVNTDPVPDSSTFYNLSNIPRLLPPASSVEEAIAILQPTNPSLFNNNRLVMYNNSFLQSILKMLRDYNNIKFGLRSTDVSIIQNFFQTEDDFLPSLNSRIFLNDHSLNLWLSSVKHSSSFSTFFNLRNKIEVAMGFSLEPYLYRDSSGKIYLIQNVVGGLRQKAEIVADAWLSPDPDFPSHSQHINIGPDPLIPDIVSPFPVLIYGISPSSTLIVLLDDTRQSPSYLKILYYGTYSDLASNKDSRYAAMLELL